VEGAHPERLFALALRGKRVYPASPAAAAAAKEEDEEHEAVVAAAVAAGEENGGLWTAQCEGRA